MTSQSTFDRQPSHNAFVGRERELAELRAGLDDVSASHGRLFLLSGEPGIGKTRLAEEISNEATARGMRMVWGRCWEGGGAPAYWPFIQILRACIEGRDSEDLKALLGSGASEIALLIPEIKLSLPSLEGAKAATDSESARFRLFDAVAMLLKNVARNRPLLMAVDDLHDADHPSLQMLRFIARAAKDVPLLMICTYRDAEVKRSPQLAKLVGDLIREGRSLSLTGLSKAEVGDFVASRTGRAADERLVADLYRATDGNALYVEGVVRLLESGGRPEQAGSDRGGFKIPDGVRESIRRQLAALSDDANSLVSIASVIGNEFDMRLLERVFGRAQEQLVEQTDEAVRLGVLRAGAPGFARQQFSHALIREVLYDDLPVSRRIELHRDIAAVIEQIYASDLKPHWAELARHLTEAGNAAKAIDFWIKAGEVAYSVFGFEEAASCWRTALAMTENQRTDPLVRARLLERLGDSTTVGDFDPAKCVEHLEAALRIYQDLGDVERAARVHTHLGHWMSSNLAAMDIPRALAHYQKAEAVLNKLPERVSLGSLYTGFGAAAREAMQTKEGLRTSSRAMQIAERLGAETLWIYAASLHSDLLLNAGRIEEALALSDKACVKADALNDAGAASGAARSACANYSRLWDPCQTESYISRELGKARLAEAPQLQEGLRVWLDIAHLQKGEFKSRNRLGTSKQWDAFVQANEKIYSGEWELARSIAARSIAYCRRVGSRDATARSMLYAAMVCRLKGQFEEGVAQLREILSMCADDLNSLCEVEALPELALILVETVRVGDAQSYLKRWREIMSAGEDWRGLEGAGARAEAVAASAQEKYEDAEAQFEKAVEIFRRYHVPLEEAEALHYWGRALNASGEHGRANEKLDAAIEIYRRCGAGERWVQRVEADRQSSRSRTEKGEHTADAQSQAIFCREGDFWTIAYEGKTWRLKDAKGLHYIAHLLGHPGEEIRALDLAARSSGGGEEGVDVDSAEDLARTAVVAGDLGHAGEMLDMRAKADYQRRLSELEDELEEAREFKNEERIAKAEDEKEALGRELRGAIGLAGRDRRSASATERGRIAVTKAIRLSLNKIAENDASLGKLLSTTIKTGTVCAYLPDARFPVAWRL